MRRTLLLMVLSAMSGAALVAGTAALASGSRDARAPLRFHVVERAVTDQVVDIGAKGDSPGDLLPFANPIYDASNTKREGSDQGSCVRASAVQGRWECMYTTFLPHGQVTVEGPFLDARKTTRLAVTGGTGAYANVRGALVLHLRADGNFDFFFRLLR
jgi:allene oxide cyclase